LDDKNIRAANILMYLKMYLSIGEILQSYLRRRNSEMLAYQPAKQRV